MAGVPEIHCCKKEEPDYSPASHFLESPVRRIHSAADDAELASRHLLAQQIVFREVYLLVKTFQFVKSPLIEKHEHPGAERLMQAGQVLEKIVAEINAFIEPVTFAANDIRGDAMKALLLCQFDGAPDQRIRGRFDIGVDEEHVMSVGPRRSGIAAD